MAKVKTEKTAGGFWYFLQNMNKKHRISIRDQHGDAEVGYMYISTWRLTFAFLGMFLVLAAGVVALVVYTPILDRLPGHPGQRTRDMLSEGILKLDSLENELSVMTAYGENVRRIMEGKPPVLRTAENPEEEIGSSKDIVPPSAADSLLRQQLESLDGRYALVHDGGQSSPGLRRMEFVAPMTGRVETPFNPSAGMNGVSVSFAGPRQIAAAAPGTIVMSLWTPEDDHIVQIQHRDNYISIYKGISQSLKSVGDRVEAGEAIGHISGGEGLDSVCFVFELWSDGQPADPQRYILFD